ncbi:MAG: hypothetical protein FJ404_18735 [Verrucomicrobia bacterium]|nr:hypothetical protein [Verrucomicrobiota bacterium]
MPAISVRPESSYDDAARRDVLLEHAMDYMDGRHATGMKTYVHGQTDSDGDGVRDVDEFVAMTDPAHSSSRFLVEVNRVGSGLRWNSANRRSYAILRASEPTGPWFEFSTGNAASGVAEVPRDGAAGFFRLRVELSP